MKGQVFVYIHIAVSVWDGVVGSGLCLQVVLSRLFAEVLLPPPILLHVFTLDVWSVTYIVVCFCLV